MNQWIAIVLVLGLFAIGDVVSSATGARISSVFVTRSVSWPSSCPVFSRQIS